MGAPIISGFRSQRVDTQALADTQRRIYNERRQITEPKDLGFFQDLFNSFGQGYATGESVDEAFDIFKLGSNVDEKTLQNYVNIVNQMDQYGMTNEQYNYQEDSKKMVVDFLVEWLL